MFCSNCGKEIADKAVVCVHCGCATGNNDNRKSMLTAVLLWFFLGYIGAHRYYLGHSGSATTQLLLWIIGWATIIIIVGAIPLTIILIWWIVDIIMLVSGSLKPKDRSNLI